MNCPEKCFFLSTNPIKRMAFKEWFNSKKRIKINRHTSYFMSHRFCRFFNFVIVPKVFFYLSLSLALFDFFFSFQNESFDFSYVNVFVYGEILWSTFFSHSIQMQIGRRIDDCKCISPLLNLYACKFTHKIERQTDRQINSMEKLNERTNEMKGNCRA